jgi:hypothetical protein
MQPTEKTTITRLAKRGSYDTDTIYGILDESLFCHISYVFDNQPFIIPTGYCRIDDTIYLHGSVGSHFFREMAKGIEVCMAVSFIDGLVLARSVFHHSVNYRSVVIFGKTRLVENADEKWLALEKFTEHVMPGRWADARQPDTSEMKKTMVIAIKIEEASAKIRTGEPNDDDEDMALDVWAGVLPLVMTPQKPQPHSLLKSGIELPDYIKNYKKNVGKD